MVDRARDSQWWLNIVGQLAAMLAVVGLHYRFQIHRISRKAAKQTQTQSALHVELNPVADATAQPVADAVPLSQNLQEQRDKADEDVVAHLFICVFLWQVPSPRQG